MLRFERDELRALLASLRRPNRAGADARLARQKRRDRGVYFTPPVLARFVADKLVESRGGIDWTESGAPRLRILDPAAGDGRFLLELADSLVRRCPIPEVGLKDVLPSFVALERDETLAALCRQSLPGADVRCCEALLGAGALGKFDVVVGNPPYVRSNRLGETDGALLEALRGQYSATSHGEWDLYTAFIEQSLRWLSPGGSAGLVVPSRWLTARSARELRRTLAAEQAVSGLVDFGAEQLFDAATTYSSTLFLSRAPKETVAVARLRGEHFDIGTVEMKSLDAAPWRISVGRGRQIVESMRAAGPPLGELARIIKGTGTNADAVFVSESELDVEEELTRTCVRGRDVAAFGSPNPRVRIVIPYELDGRLIEPEVLATRFPRAARYLERHRDRLEAREKGRFRGPRFYQFGRPQNLATLLSRQKKIVVPDVARAGRAMLDDSGALVLDSAYAILAKRDDDLERILAVLNSPAVALWLRETGIPLRGGYVRMKTAYLESLPIAERGSRSLHDRYNLTATDWRDTEI